MSKKQKTNDLIAFPDEKASDVDKWIHYKTIEKLVKKELKKLSDKATKTVENTDDKFYQNKLGKVQHITSVTEKPKDSLEEFLTEKGFLNQCLKGDIDLKKVKTLVDAGIITKEELNEHIEKQTKKYIKYTKK